MAKPNTRRHGNPDSRHRVPGPWPAVAEIEAELTALLTPALFAPRQLEGRDPRTPTRQLRLRARILTLPVMVALVVSLVWRRLGAIAEVQRVLVQDGSLWWSPLQVSEQAIAKRLETLPVSALAAVFTNDKRFAPEILAVVPLGGLLVFDVGFCSVLWFDDFTDQQKFFVTRLCQKTAYRTTHVFSQTPYYRDKLSEVGLYRSNPCHPPLRLVSVLWQGHWYRSLTNVRDSTHLSAPLIKRRRRRHREIQQTEQVVWGRP